MTVAAYDAIAEWYDTLVRSGTFAADLVTSRLLSLVGDVNGHSICDVGCGQGRLTRVLAQGGAQMIGVDLSRNLIVLAQRDERDQPLGIDYRVDDAARLTTLADSQCDGVVCHLALMDMPDLTAVVTAVWRVLRPGGWFVYSITHPCFEAPHAAWVTKPDGSIGREITSYFPEGFWRSDNPHGVRGQVGAYHRTLAAYLTTLVQAPFSLQQIVEPHPAADEAVAAPGYRVVPAFLLVRCIKPDAPMSGD